MLVGKTWLSSLWHLWGIVNLCEKKVESVFSFGKKKFIIKPRYEWGNYLQKHLYILKVTPNKKSSPNFNSNVITSEIINFYSPWNYKKNHEGNYNFYFWILASSPLLVKYQNYSEIIYLFKVNNRNTKRRQEIC